MRWIVRTQKDSLSTDSNKNVVYKLTCKNCEASYVRQAKRKLNTRVVEHKNDIKKLKMFRLLRNIDWD